MSISPVFPNAQASDSFAAASSTSSSATDSHLMFMQLLATELQAQDTINLIR
jgi:flagellar hook assembly protein FlgD